jgi:hypothetical protein
VLAGRGRLRSIRALVVRLARENSGLVVTCRGSLDHQPASAPRTGLDRVNRMAILCGSFFLTIKQSLNQ